MYTTAFLASCFIRGVLSKRERELDCTKANIPFISESDATQQARSLINCVYNYWLLGCTYDGAKGFQKMWGKNGDFFNESTIINLDGKQVTGYNKWWKGAVVSQSLVSVVSSKNPPRDNMILSSWSPYTISVSYQIDTKSRLISIMEQVHNKLP